MATQHYLPHIDEDKVLRISVEHAKAGLEHRPQGTRAVRSSKLLGATATSSVPYNTNGWDTVYAIPLPDVNNAIAVKKSSPTTWSGKLPAGDFNPEIDATGTFGTWSLTTGGSGSIVRMHIPFTATLVYNGMTKPIDGGIAFVEVKLVYLPQPPVAGVTPNDLVVRSTGGSQDDPVVTVSDVTYDSPPMTDSTKNVLEQLLAQWFNANLDSFAHVFATVDLGIDEASGDFSWLNPTQTNYAYIDNASISDALLGVLCMTENRSDHGAVQEIAAGAIPDGARASFNMSQERFMTKMALPSLPAEFPNAPTGTFVLANDDTQILSTSSFNLDAVKVGAINYTPNCTTYKMTLNGDVMETYAYIHTPISPGIDAYCEVTYYSTVELGTKDDGTQSLTWQQVQATDEKTWYTVATWVTITEAVADIILAVIGAVVSGVAVAVERVVCRILVALLCGGVVSAIAAVLEQIPEWIAGSVPDALPSVNALVDGATTPITWANSTEFKLTTVVLNGGLQLGGTPFSS
ncbi:MULTISPECIES: TULIP family P47-like protein [Streptacidiphilus]|uniref:TULIP family P47-like protein n=2 Tax=Streptacidiphilus TaxID=228398 RepID=A0ABV6UVS9_9ACTN|nr:TULIP family P47-like protein [Streptacidiphilus jeojiense]